MGVHFNRYLMWAFPGLLALARGGSRPPRDPPRPRARARDRTVGVFRAVAALCLVLGGSVDRPLRHPLRGRGGRGVAPRRGHRGLDLARTCPPGRGHGQHRHERRVPDRPPQPEPARRDEPRLLRQPHGGAGGGHLRGPRPAARSEPVRRSSSRASRPRTARPSCSTLTLKPPLFQSSSFSDELLVLRMDYELVGKNQALFSHEAKDAVAGLSEVDRLNVCDSRDEAAHRYRYVVAPRQSRAERHRADRLLSPRLPGRPLGGRRRRRPRHPRQRVVPGARRTPGRDLVVVMRTAGSAQAAVLRSTGSGVFELEVPEAGIIVHARGEMATRVGFRPQPGWNELVFRVPRPARDRGPDRAAAPGSVRFALFLVLPVAGGLSASWLGRAGAACYCLANFRDESRR